MSSHSKIPLISIIGTTGVGKSQLSIHLASKFNGEIINADSMQMYQKIPQITNKHPIEERNGVIHHVMDHVSWDEEYFIHRFKKEALSAIEDIHSRGKIPIIVGGTHYYLQSLLFTNKTIETSSNDLMGDLVNDNNTEDRLTDVEKSILNGPVDLILKELKKLDPVISEKFHPNDHRRIRRALEICYATKKPASDIYNSQKKTEVDESSLRFNTLFFWLFSKPNSLDERLDARVDKMMDLGAIDELHELYQYYLQQGSDVELDRGVWQVIGFKEFLPYLTKNPDILSKNKNEVLNNLEFKECLDEMKLKTRRYARRQVKWIKTLLVPELANESKHEWINGGKVFVLDATNLTQWNEQVGERGEVICENFLNGELNASSSSLKQVPESLSDEKLGFVDPNKNFDQSKWKHYTCDVCLGKDFKPLVLVGDQYQDHLNSRKHRNALRKKDRGNARDEWIAKKAKQEAAEQ
ncbi:hypothetical protein CANARDRAFT_30355 [[Candida] arabinofermentans NRRL YB-2248]|uniref:tRNA dimethylallyltransferase n=1 Tax=[Candida] arabinofermentans NRRL YB-2248 TaxID=983967 RepID=A0A1E4SU28_9ASCO|nr:hypothetical protein CANARDRAFT_30355 [[Candida] arabinofermentans NRRL YB-2248]